MPQLDDSLSRILAEAIAEFRDGGRPSAEEYARRYPRLAQEISELLPVVLDLERARGCDSPGQRSDAQLDDELLEPCAEPLGDFQIVREIGRGGMGIVYEAIQTSLRRRVALKVLPRWAMQDPRMIQRFQREALAAARMHHSNIVPILGVGEARGRHYLVMQLIDGHALDQVIDALRALRGLAPAGEKGSGAPAAAEGRLGEETSQAEARYTAGSLLSGGFLKPGASRRPSSEESSRASAAPGTAFWRSVAHVGAQVADALQYAATQGLIHRDIKPSNLILDSRGTAWVADFGLARAIDSADLTTTNELVGTLRYMPPERLRGQADARGDVYGLGATLYALATLKPPFAAQEQLALLRQIADREPPAPRTLAPSLPRELETILVKAMSKNPADRYASPGELAEDLRRFIEDRPIRARRATVVERLWRWCRRHPAVALPTAAAIFLLMFTTLGSVLVAARLERERNAAQDAEQRAVSAERARREELFRAHVANVQSAAATGRPGQQSNALRAVHDAVGVLPAQERTAEQEFALVDALIPCLASADVRELARIPLVSGRVDAVDVDPAFQYFAQPVEGGAGVQIARLDNPTEGIRIGAVDQAMSGFHSRRRFSESGRWLAEISVASPEGDPWRARIWNRETGQLALETSVVPHDGCLAFHPDDRRAMILGVDQVLRSFDLTTGRQVAQSPRRYDRARISYCADGSRLAIAAANLPVEIVDSETWEIVDRLSELGPMTAVMFDPHDAQTLLVGAADGRVASWNVETMKATPHQPWIGHDVRGFALSGNGLVVAITDRDATQVRRRDGDDALLELTGRVTRVSADGSKLAVVEGGRELVVYSLIASAVARRMHWGVESIVFSPDNRLAALSGPGGVALHSSDTFERRGNLGLDHCGPVAFRADQTALVTCGCFTQACLWPLSDGGQGTVGPPRPLCTPTMPAFHTGTLSPQRDGREAVFAPDGRLYFADYRHDHILTWDDLTQPPRTFASMYNVGHVVVDPTGRWVAATAAFMTGAKIWDARGGDLVLEVPEAWVATFSADGRWLALTTNVKLLIYDTSRWTLAHGIDLESSLHAAFQPGGSLLAVTGHEQRIDLYELPSARLVARLPRTKGRTVNDLAFTPDGRRLAVVESDGLLAVWDLAALERELAELGLSLLGRLTPTPGTAAAASAPACAAGPLVVDRGSLPPADEWFQCWHRLALNEAGRGNWPDAVADIQIAIDSLPARRTPELALLLAERGTYQSRNDEPEAARDSWEHSLRADLGTGDAARHLVRLHLFGPVTIRSNDRAGLIMGLLGAHGEWTPEQQVIRALIEIRAGQFDNGLARLARTEIPPAWRLEAAYLAALARHGLGETGPAAAALADATALHEAEAVSLDVDRRRDLDQLREEVEATLASRAKDGGN